MRLSTLRGLAHVDASLRVEALRRTWTAYVLRVVSHDLHGKERVDLLTDIFMNTVTFNSIEEIKDCLNAVQDLESFYIRHTSAHGEMSGIDDKIRSKKSSDGGIKIPLHKE